MKHHLLRPFAFAASLALVSAPVPAAPAAAGETQPAAALRQRVEARLRALGPGPRFGLIIADDQGRELIAISPDDRFIPASNIKLLTTATAYATLSGIDSPDAIAGAVVRLEPGAKRLSDVVLEGRGDARLSSAPDCAANCLTTLADAIAGRVRRVGRVIGDASFFVDQRWSPGMSWNNISTRYGTAVSALSLDDNELALTVAPGAVGAAPKLDLLPYYSVDNRAMTVAEGPTALAFDRLPGSRQLLLTGTIAAGSAPERLLLGIDDPAHFAAWRLQALLVDRGVRVASGAIARHRPAGSVEPAQLGKGVAGPPPAAALAQLTPPPLAEDVRRTNKSSQNLHAELLLRRIGLTRGEGSIDEGLAGVRELLTRAGVESREYALADGSGMSTYNRLTPRAVAKLLRWAAAQPWGAAWRETLPIAGVDGTLARRFRGTALEGRLFAKTGSLNASTALSGYMTARSGRRLIFSAFANDVPEDVAATAAIDSALIMIAEAY